MSDKDAEKAKQGLEEALSEGLLLNYRLSDVKAILLERGIQKILTLVISVEQLLQPL
ncbi:15234_t:CDS:1, partial [Gigaspora margarita]